MIIGLLAPLIIAIIVITTSRRSSREGINSAQVRRFFQYLLLYILVVLTAVGLSGLLGQIISGDEFIVGSSSLARNASFLVVGAPVLFLLSRWTRRTLEEDRDYSLWATYVTAVSITALLVVITSAIDVILGLVQNNEFQADRLVTALVWMAVWLIHWRLDSKAQRSHLHLVLGSFVSLVVLVIGSASLVRGILQSLFQNQGDLFLRGATPLQSGVAYAVVGGLWWFWYWIRHYYREARDELWTLYVLIAGVAAGLIMAITSTSTLLYRILVWFVGDPQADSASAHFRNLSTTLSIAIVGVVLWWYHQAVLSEGVQTRTEARRVYEYLISGISIVASAVGISIVFSALVESLTQQTEVYSPSPINTLLAGMTVLLVAFPIWLLFWRKILSISGVEEEQHSPTRRIYLFLLFGVGGIVAIGSLIAAAYILFQSFFEANFGVETIRLLRIPVGMLISTALVSGYHWRVFRGDRVEVQRLALKQVLLIGPADAVLVQKIQRRGVRVEHNLAELGVPWDHSLVLSQIGTVESSKAVFIADRAEPIRIERN